VSARRRTITHPTLTPEQANVAHPHHRSFTSRSASLVAALLLASSACASAQGTHAGHQPSASASPAARDSADVARVIGSFHAALERGDSAAALALLAPDVTVLESGGVESLAEYRGHHLPADIEYARAVPSVRGPVRVTVRGDVAWAASTSDTKGTFKGRAVDSAGAELMVLTRTAAGWRISAIHWSSRRRSS
jgi:ketosteroid isomerase-like protein